MKIKLAFLGTGTCNSTFRNPQAFALSNGQEVVMIDFGGGSYHQLARLNRKDFLYNKINIIFLSHYHVDHVSGLLDFFWGEMWDTKGKRESPLTIVGPTGLSDFYNNRLLPFIGDYQIPFKVNLIEISEGNSFDYTFFKATSYKLAHGNQSTGYLFDFNKVTLSITSDTGYCENLVTLLKASNIAVMEWGNLTNNAGHLTDNDIMKLIKYNALPKITYITHMYLPYGITFKEQVIHNIQFLGENADRFVFPADLDVVELL